MSPLTDWSTQEHIEAVARIVSKRHLVSSLQPHNVGYCQKVTKLPVATELYRKLYHAHYYLCN